MVGARSRQLIALIKLRELHKSESFRAGQLDATMIHIKIYLIIAFAEGVFCTHDPSARSPRPAMEQVAGVVVEMSAATSARDSCTKT